MYFGYSWNPLPPSDAVRQQKKTYLKDLFSFQSLKLRTFMEKSFRFLLDWISLQMYFGLLWVNYQELKREIYDIFKQ